MPYAEITGAYLDAKTLLLRNAAGVFDHITRAFAARSGNDGRALERRFE